MDFYCECWNIQCVMLNAPDVRKDYLRKETQAIKLESINGTIKNYNRPVNIYSINGESESFEITSMWINRARV